MADALFEFVGSFSLVCAFVQLRWILVVAVKHGCTGWEGSFSQAAVEMSEGCFRRLRSLPRGTCLFLVTFISLVLALVTMDKFLDRLF